jgi:photosystem II stability/assembly factor-like uncharacterized protein
MIRSLVIEPQNSATVYAVAGIGIFKSTNSGASWSSVYSYSAADPQFSTIAVDPKDRDTLYALRIGFGGVFKSVDGGVTWTAANSGLPATPNETFPIIALAIHPQNPHTLYVATGYGIYWSTDGAASWSALNSGLKDLSALVVDPHNSGTLYAAARTGIFKSIDGAANWRGINSGLRAIEITRLAFISQKPATLYAYGQDDIFKSTDEGTSWSPANFLYPLAIDPHDPVTIFGIAADGLAKSIDGASFTPSHDGFSSQPKRAEP